MAGAGIFLLLVGYGIFYAGLDWVRGGNDGFLDLIVPGRFTSTAPKDSPAPSSQSLTDSQTKNVVNPAGAAPASKSPQGYQFSTIPDLQTGSQPPPPGPNPNGPA